MQEPTVKRAIAFVDGQNLFHCARETFGHRHPNYDVAALAKRVCETQGWDLRQVRFYTGVPDASDEPFWHHFWNAKFAQMGREGVWSYRRPLKYRNQTYEVPGGGTLTKLVGAEKGIDIRIALDVVALARRWEFDVALVFSQDQDLSEVADEVRDIAQAMGRWIKIASAYPWSPVARNRRGIDKTDWIKIDRATYDACLDPRDYRPKHG